jgi:hypothetical protein
MQAHGQSNHGVVISTSPRVFDPQTGPDAAPHFGVAQALASWLGQAASGVLNARRVVGGHWAQPYFAFDMPRLELRANHHLGLLANRFGSGQLPLT